MTEGDRAAIHIDALAVPAQFVADGQRLDGKSFVSFYQIKVVDIPACAFQGRTRCRNRAKPHYRRINTRHRIAGNVGHWGKVKLAGFLRTHHQHCCGTVVE